MKTIINLFVLVFIYSVLLNTAYAQKPSDSDALQGLNEGKVIWDVTVGNPSKLLFLLKTIDETYDDLLRQDVTPDMVFLFHGRATRLVSTQKLDLTQDEQIAHEKAVKLIQKLSKQPGVKMESCSISARILEIDNKTIIPGIKPVGNTFVSQIGYQKQGYATIPIH